MLKGLSICFYQCAWQQYSMGKNDRLYQNIWARTQTGNYTNRELGESLWLIVS